MRAIRVMTHVPPEALASVKPPDAEVEWIHVPLDGPVPPDAQAEVLFTFTNEVPSLRETLQHGVRWITRWEPVSTSSPSTPWATAPSPAPAVPARSRSPSG